MLFADMLELIYARIGCVGRRELFLLDGAGGVF
jgi:hypothetical protein